VKHQQFKDLVICFSREFLIELAGSTFVTIIFATNFMIFFRRGCVGGVNFFVFLFAQRLLETRLFLFSPKRGKTIRR